MKTACMFILCMISLVHSYAQTAKKHGDTLGIVHAPYNHLIDDSVSLPDSFDSITANLWKVCKKNDENTLPKRIVVRDDRNLYCEAGKSQDNQKLIITSILTAITAVGIFWALGRGDSGDPYSDF